MDRMIVSAQALRLVGTVKTTCTGNEAAANDLAYSAIIAIGKDSDINTVCARYGSWIDVTMLTCAIQALYMSVRNRTEFTYYIGEVDYVMFSYDRDFGASQLEIWSTV